jgi:carbamoyltransferase
MIILGLSPLDKDATVSLLVDGQLTWAIAEERLSRQKMHAGFPYLALQMVLDRAGITAQDVDRVVYAFQDCDTETMLMRRNVQSDFELNRSPANRSLRSLVAQALPKIPIRSEAIPGLPNPNERMVKPWYKRIAYHLATGEGKLSAWMNARQFSAWLEMASDDHRRYQAELLAGLKRFGLDEKLTRVEHHQTHIANAYYCSGFEQALVVTIDAYGSGLSGTVSIANRTEGIRRLAEIETPYSLGVFYETVTSALGFRPDRHAGKIVGLAAYGDPGILGDVLRNLFQWDGARFRMRRSSDLYLGRYLASQFPKIDVAAAYQTVLEEVVVRHVSAYVAETGLDTVVLSGGVTANVKLNQRIHEIPGVKHIYVHPNMGDGGCGTGAALVASVAAGEQPRRLDTCYLGPDYSDAEIESALQATGLNYERYDEIEVEIARSIADNRVVARFAGRMEYGPRALGNRSILYPAKDPAVNQWLNERLGRTEFMPFAPATLYEAREKCYLNLSGAEFTALFMTITFDCTPWMRENCPAAVHIDGTARPQLVTAESNPSYYRILQEYEKLTGIPSVINTSFNMHEEPIVCTPADAIRAFQLGKLDYLAIGPFLVAASDLASQQVSAGRRVEVGK